MGKYAFALNGKFSGKFDQMVANRNHVFRDFVMPSFPGTPAQTLQESNFAAFSAGWNLLSEDDRASWIAQKLDRVDRLGHPYIVSGKDLYNLANRNLFNAGQAPTDTCLGIAAPVPVATLALASLGGPGVDAFSITFTATPVPAGFTMLVYGTQSLSAGTYKPAPSQFKLIDALPAATTSPESIDGGYRAVYGDTIVGGTVFARVVIINNTTGMASAPVTARAIVA